MEPGLAYLSPHADTGWERRNCCNLHDGDEKKVID